MKRKNVIIGIILAILMVVAIIIGIVNPKRVKLINTTSNNENNREESNETLNNQIENNQIENNQNALTQVEIMEQEEKEYSMQRQMIGEQASSTVQYNKQFCKVGNTAIYYDVEKKDLYVYNLENNQSKKIATLQTDLDDIYFDGTYIYVCIYGNETAENNGIFRIDLDGNTQRINEEESLQLAITDNRIYFVKQIGHDEANNNPQGELCAMDKDGENATKIADNLKNYFCIQDDKIYYTTQDRKMYQINTDGTNQIELAQGRKFPLTVNGKYLTYIDYGNQDAEHLLNLETKEDVILGYSGISKKFNGKTYVITKKRSDDGSIENNFTIFEIDRTGNVTEKGKIDNFISINYIINNKIYMLDEEGKTEIIDLENTENNNENNYSECNFFIGGYGYKINGPDTDELSIEKVQL